MQKEIAINKISHYSFGGIRYYPNRSEVVINKESKCISGYPKKVLDFLLDSYPESISKENLISLVWVNNAGNVEKLNTHLSTLRNILDDNNSTDEKTGNKQIQWSIIDSVSIGYLAIKPKVTTCYFNDANSPRSRLAYSLGGISIGSLLMLTFLFGFKPASHTPLNQKSLSELKGEFERAAVSQNRNVIAYTYKPVGSTQLNLFASNLSSGSINRLTNETEPNTYNTEPNFSPSGEQVVWVRTDYKSFCDIFVANFDENNLTIDSKKSVFKCDQEQLVRTPHFRTESSLLVSISDFQVPYSIMELDLWTSKKKVITQNQKTTYGDYSLFYNPNNQQVVYVRQSTNTGTELRLYDFNNHTDTLIKQYPYWLYSVAWLNDEQVVVQSNDGYDVLSTKGAHYYSASIEVNQTEPLHYPFTIGGNMVGFIKGRLVDRDIIVMNLKDKTHNDSLSTRYNDYLSVIAKDNNSIAYFSLKDKKHQLFYATKNSRKSIAEIDFNASILDFAISPDGNTIAYQIGNRLMVRDNSGEKIFTDNIEMTGFTFSSDSQNLLIAKSNDNDEPTIVSRTINNHSQSKIIATGFMPKMSEGKLYYMRKSQTDGQIWLYQLTKNGQAEIFKIPFSITQLNSNSFDIINHHIYYIENGHVVKVDLTTQLKTIVAKVGGRSFSINNAEDTLVSTIKSPIQNNIISIELPE